MKFDFLDESALVQKKKKYANFTIKEIGGPEEIKKWREMQAAKESIYRMRLNQRDERLANFEQETRQKLVTPEIKTRTWAEKQAHAESERHRLSQAELDVILYPPWEVSEPPKKTLLQRFTNFISSVWKYANF